VTAENVLGRPSLPSAPTAKSTNRHQADSVVLYSTGPPCGTIYHTLQSYNAAEHVH